MRVGRLTWQCVDDCHDGVDIGAVLIEMWGEADATGAWHLLDVVGQEMAVQGGGIGVGEYEDSGLAVFSGVEGGEDTEFSFLQFLDEQCVDGADAVPDCGWAGFQEHGDAFGEGSGTDDVMGSCFEPLDAVSGFDDDFVEVAGVDDGMPTHDPGFDVGEPFFGEIENAAPFRGEHPFMTSGGQGVDAGGLDVQGAGPQALYGIDDEQGVGIFQGSSDLV